MLEFLLGCAIAIVFVLVMATMIHWIVHIYTVIDENTTYGYAGYRKFMKQFNKTKWFYSESFRWSLFGKEGFSVRVRKDDIFASNIKFNSNGMIINNPFSFLLVRLYVVNYIRKNHLVKKDKAERKNRVLNKWY